MRFAVAAAVSAGLVLAGCATAQKDIVATSVSPLQYSQYTCQQIVAENHRVLGKVSQIGARLDEAASNDQTIAGVGLVLFWPALFALGGTKQQEAEYARLKGEHDALQQAAIQKQCGMGTSYAVATPVQPSVPAQPQMTPVAATPQATGPVQLAVAAPIQRANGQDAPGAERLAREQSCHETPQATLLAKGGGFESYSVACTNGDALAIRCEFGNCRVLK